MLERETIIVLAWLFFGIAVYFGGILFYVSHLLDKRKRCDHVFEIYRKCKYCGHIERKVQDGKDIMG